MQAVHSKRDGKIYNSKNGITSICVDSLCLEPSWELYQKPIDWGYIIENRIPCWFWNIERKVLGILVDYNEDDMYLRDGDSYYQNCRPVRRDEINFYEDKK